MHRSSTQGNGAVRSCGIPSIPCHLQRSNTSNVPIHGISTYVHPPRKRLSTATTKETARKTKEQKVWGGKTQRTERNMKQKQTCDQSEGRVPRGHGCLLVGIISPVICPVVGPQEGRHVKTRRKTRQEEGRHGAKKQKPAVLCIRPAGGPRMTHETKMRAETKG